MKADDLQAELDRLWSKVNSEPDRDPPPLPSSGEVDAPIREASLEALHLVRRQRETESAELKHLLALKEQAASEASERLKIVQAENIRLRQQLNRRERASLDEAVALSAKLEESKAGLRAQEDRFSQEERVLRDIAEKTRQQLAAETARWRELEHQWGQREQQYLLEIKEAQALLSRAEQAAGQADGRSRKSFDDLRTAKGAVEATLGELLKERQLRDAADKERARALEKVAEVEAHFDELQKLWREERQQWQELWDREHASWDARKQELSGWEERLRKERESGLAGLRSREESAARLTEQMAKNLRESTEASGRLARLLRGLRSGRDAASVRGRRLATVGLAVALVAAAAVPAWLWMTRLRLEPVWARAVPVENATALAFDGDHLWVAAWPGELVCLDGAKPDQVVSRVRVDGVGAYHPGALTTGASTLWSVDTAQARLLRHAANDPALPRDIWPSPGPAPLAVAYDGKQLWSYDAVTRQLYRHLGEGPQAQLQTFPVALDVVPTSMQWAGKDLWMHDSKGRRLLRLRIVGGAVEAADSLALPADVTSAAVAWTGEKRSLWTLSPAPAAQGGALVRRYELGGR
ncbi:MAG: hypothetical protein NTX64_16925 [Elusimicrobia bacterium]|nr:hypothetical protein [Elusimicrobiota bacterium]